MKELVMVFSRVGGVFRKSWGWLAKKSVMVYIKVGEVLRDIFNTK